MAPTETHSLGVSWCSYLSGMETHSRGPVLQVGASQLSAAPNLRARLNRAKVRERIPMQTWPKGVK
ncbi:hypothetical protein [Alicyclobacillus pomorum]|uniref:hypothetical protein n=1 Tax=Alicyclobacillus pomorum TaxID=204470 RepID=UPI0004249E86|nr:hypothetical protein [Alicyclobacillus pomorum]